MKNLKKLQQKRMDNKGFSLVELIIVIAIMAILVGIVGTQVIPYLNRSREAKDVQILDAFSTAAVSAYSMNAESDVFSTAQQAALTASASSTATQVKVKLTDISEATHSEWIDAIYSLTSYKSFADIQKAMSSTAGKSMAQIQIVIDFYDNTLTVTAYNNKDTLTDANQILETVTSHL